MANKIKSRAISDKDPKYSWPFKSEEPSGERGVFYFRKVEGEFDEYGNQKYESTTEPPEPIMPIYGSAPLVMLDAIKPRYHNGACRTIESRKEWEMENKAHNMLTFSSLDDAKPKRNEYEEKKKKREEYRKASKAAIETVRSNPREVSQKLEKQGEAQMETLKKSGISLDNAVVTTKGK